MKYHILNLFPIFESASVSDILRPKEKYDVEENLRLAKDAVENSPYIDMASYSLGAIVLFGALIIAVFFLIMILKR